MPQKVSSRPFVKCAPVKPFPQRDSEESLTHLEIKAGKVPDRLLLAAQATRVGSGLP